LDAQWYNWQQISGEVVSFIIIATFSSLLYATLKSDHIWTPKILLHFKRVAILPSDSHNIVWWLSWSYWVWCYL